MLIGDKPMFNKVWKKQIVQPTAKVGIFKPKQGFDLEDNEDNKCCEEARKKFLETGAWHEWREWPCEELYDFLNRFRHRPLEKVIIEEWDRCENGN